MNNRILHSRLQTEKARIVKNRIYEINKQKLIKSLVVWLFIIVYGLMIYGTLRILT